MRHEYSLRYFSVAFVIFITCVSASLPARSADNSLRATLQSRYAAMKAAMAAHDGAAVAAILAPNFVSIDLAGKPESASHMIAEVNSLKPDPRKSSETTLMSITPQANTVTVKQQYHMKTIRTAADGTQHNIELLTLSTDTWVKPANVWLIERTVTNELSYYKDGRLVVHKIKPQAFLWPNGPSHGSEHRPNEQVAAQ